MSPDDPAITAAGNLTEALNGVSARLDKAEKDEKKNRRALWVLAAVAVALALAVASLALWNVRQDAARESRIAQRSAHLCAELNRSRAAIQGVWDKVLPAVWPDTPAGRREAARLEATIRAALPLRNCAKASAARR